MVAPSSRARSASAFVVEDGSAYPDSASYDAAAMSSTVIAGTRAFTSVGEMSVTRAPMARARETLRARFPASRWPTSTRYPTCWKPGSPPPMTSRQCWKMSAAALAVRVKKSMP